MKNDTVRVYEARIIEEEEPMTIIQICERCKLSKEEIIELIEEGIIYPKDKQNKSLSFSFDTIDRILKVKRLKRDMDLNMAGVALAVNLLDRIEELERKILRMNL